MICSAQLGRCLAVWLRLGRGTSKRRRLVEVLAKVKAVVEHRHALGREAGRRVERAHFPDAFNDIFAPISPAPPPPADQGAPGGRIVSGVRLDEEAFREAARGLGAAIRRYRKTGRVAALTATERQTVVTYWNGE